MEIDDNKNSNYYIKEVEDEEHVKHNVFYVNKNISINKKMLKEMEKYNCKIVELLNLEFNLISQYVIIYLKE